MTARAPRRLRRLALAVALLAVGVSAPAALASSSSTLTLSVGARAQHPGELALVAGGAGKTGAPVAFFVVSTEFGQPRDVPIGVAKTGANGTARISYRPTWAGKEKFVAKLTGLGDQPPTATATYRVTSATPGPLAGAANPPRPLADVGGVFLKAILTAVALVWLSLIVVLALAFGRLPRLAGRGVD